ncbi:ABC transporter ATP-binding protein/permease [Pendulispora brunnea]|uniref:ABC transporter ATP-binding protein/permease n=1 Tax=Pendulispora brunnea TaxID=2905690 RepID=A0ABZ2K3I2_9BACT
MMEKDKLPIWPVARIEEALYRLGRRDDLTPTFDAIAKTILEPRDLQAWLYAAASRGGLEAEPLWVDGNALEQAIRTAGSVLVVVSWGVLAVERARGSRATLLHPDGGTMQLPLETVCAAVRSLWERKYELGSLEAVVDRAGVSRARKAKVRASLLELQLASRKIEVGWMVRPSASAPWSEQLRHGKHLGSILKLGLAFAVMNGAAVGAWYLLGRGALSGEFDSGWLAGWGLTLASAAVLQILTRSWEGAASVAMGALLKKRLLLGALRLDPSSLRHEGLGRAMARVLEAEALEELSLAGGILGIAGTIEFVVAMGLLFRTNITVFATFLLVSAVTIWMCIRHYHFVSAWTAERMTLTQNLVEHLVGRRTREVQGNSVRLHELEDAELSRYAKVSRAMDRFAAIASVIVPRGALIAGICALVPLLVSGRSSVVLWIGIGGVLLAQRSLTRLASGLGAMLEAAVAWKRASVLVDAARKPEEAASGLGLAASLRAAPMGAPILEARQLQYRFSPERQPVLRGASLTIHSGERLLVKGPSGSGKSTLVTVLAGLRSPQSGLVLLDGLDRHVLGAEVWRKKIATAPQQHENHILQGTLAFNLLLGREWPATSDDLVEAERVCEELGLGELLDRMPGRLAQTVGSTGWRLSHGEQSRIFIARALLQRSEVVILDESLAALDPTSSERVMACVLRRARTLLLVAHP